MMSLIAHDWCDPSRHLHGFLSQDDIVYSLREPVTVDTDLSSPPPFKAHTFLFRLSTRRPGNLTVDYVDENGYYLDLSGTFNKASILVDKDGYYMGDDTCRYPTLQDIVNGYYMLLYPSRKLSITYFA